jgi:protein ImuB
MRRIACVWVPSFAAAAVERCEPALIDRPLIVVRGTPPAVRVVEANAAAREHGVAPPMTEAEARARCPELTRRPWSDGRVTSARLALLEAIAAVAPRLEDADAGLVYADVDGLDRLIGDARAVGERLVRQAGSVGLQARVGIADSRASAWIAARAHPRLAIVPPGEAAAVLAPVGLDVLDLPVDVATALERWGVRTLGELAALPREGLALRLGPAGLRAHDLAMGVDREPFHPWTPPPFWIEVQDLEWELRDLEAVVAVLRTVLARLTARLHAAHLAVDQLVVELRLASGGRHTRTVGLAYPVLDVETMLRLVRLDIDRHPPPAAVTGVAVTARPVRPEAGQGGLWRPAVPAHRDLATLLNRLVELAGRGNCGAPALTDSRRPDAVALAAFRPPPLDVALAPRTDAGDARLVVRRLRPPRAVDVFLVDGRPSAVRDDARTARVVTCAGPWRTSGEWWDAHGWARDEWDVLLDDGTLGRLVHDRIRARWMLDAIYD